MKRARLAASAAIVAVMGFAFAPLAGADTLVTFVTTAAGGRTLTAATTGPIMPVTATNLPNGQTVASATPATTQVLDVFAPGNDWHVTAEMCGLTTATKHDANPLNAVKDCSTHVMDRLETPDATIPGTDIHATTTDGLMVTPSGTRTPIHAANADMSAPITVLNNTGKVAANTYNGEYTALTSIQIQNLNQVGTWRGFWVVTAYL